jgi:hypothetical protein
MQYQVTLEVVMVVDTRHIGAQERNALIKAHKEVDDEPPAEELAGEEWFAKTWAEEEIAEAWYKPQNKEVCSQHEITITDTQPV